MSDDSESNVIRLPGSDWIEAPAIRNETICTFDDVMEGAKEGGVERIVIVGLDANDEMYFASNMRHPQDISWLLNRANNIIVTMKTG